MLVVGILAAALAVPASASRTDPTKLVLHQIDVPPLYLLEESESMLLPRLVLGEGVSAEVRRELSRTGYQTGYYATYRNTSPPYWRTIRSYSYAFRRPAGAKTFLGILDRASRGQSRATRRSSANIGDRAWVYSETPRDGTTVVVWRHGRVVAGVTCERVARHRANALALARKQERRIAAALRQG
jgi:hypothetical protein